MGRYLTAVRSGDIDAVRQRLREDPQLVRARSTREHGATLLHCVSVNGVEGYRQRSPANIASIAALLLEAGAEVGATVARLVAAGAEVRPELPEGEKVRAAARMRAALTRT